jgi:hypothetical protein
LGAVRAGGACYVLQRAESASARFSKLTKTPSMVPGEGADRVEHHAE